MNRRVMIRFAPHAFHTHRHRGDRSSGDADATAAGMLKGCWRDAEGMLVCCSL